MSQIIGANVRELTLGRLTMRLETPPGWPEPTEEVVLKSAPENPMTMMAAIIQEASLEIAALNKRIGELEKALMADTQEIEVPVVVGADGRRQ